MLVKNEILDFEMFSESGYTLTEDEINEKYQKGELRIVTEQARYPLSNIVEILGENIDFNPDYQRRRVWTGIQKSRLIESFIINVPVPPVFLYEIEFAKYEVMDGLQRLSTLYDFYTDGFELEGLEIWPELNGKKYSSLPFKVKQGIDRRYISTIVILKETAKNIEEEQMLKTFVFERLNTGGTKLSDQETRNALYDGPMNQLCIDIAKNCKYLHKLWNIKPYREKDLLKFANENKSEREYASKKVNSYVRMEDVELVLRFFAYRQLVENPASKVKDVLDLYLRVANNSYNEITIHELEGLYYSVLELAYNLFEEKAFYMYTKRKNKEFSWYKRPSKLVYDPMLIVLSEIIDDSGKKEILLEKKGKLQDNVEAMFIEHYADFNGRNNNKSDVVRRTQLFREVFNTIING